MNLFPLDCCYDFYLKSMMRKIKTKAIFFIVFFSFSSSTYADYWLDYRASGANNSAYLYHYTQGAVGISIETDVIAGGVPFIINKGGTMYTGKSRRGTIVDFKMYQYGTTTTVLGLKGAGKLATVGSSTGKCYFIPVFFAGSPWVKNIVFSHNTAAANSIMSIYAGTSQSAVLNKNCNDLSMEDIEVTQLQIPFDAAPFYIAWGTARGIGGDNLNNWSIIEYDDISVKNLKRTDNDISSEYVIFICPTNNINSSCTYTYGQGSGGTESSEGEIILPVSCILNGDNDGLNFGTVGSDDYLGKKVSFNLSVFCERTASIKFSILNVDNIHLGPFNVEVLINNEVSPVIKIDKTNDLTISGELISSRHEVKPGSYENSVIIISAVQ